MPEEIVFVVGAGGSEPYGYPIGDKLIQNIVGLISPKKGDVEERIRRMVVHEGSFPVTPEDMDDVDELYRQLRDFGGITIDEFLQYCSSTEERLTKRAMAAVLLNSERDSVEKLQRPSEIDWYHHLYSAFSKMGEESVNTNVAIVTYNYDRSLEYFLAKQRRHIRPRVIHVHGQLGRHPLWSEPREVEKVKYAPPLSVDCIDTASSGIRTVHDAKISSGKDGVLAEILRVLSDATHIFFLGFGWAEVNVDRLRLTRMLRENAIVGGTCFGLKQPELNRLAESLGDRYSRERFSEDKCLGFVTNDLPGLLIS